MVYAMLSIGIMGFMVWGHHMFMSGMSPYSGFAFSVMTMAIGVPSAIKTFNWLGTLWGGKIRLSSPMLFAIGFVSLFVSGGISGPFLAQPVLDIPLHDTYFVTGSLSPDHGCRLHLRYRMHATYYFGLFYFLFPKCFGRLMNESLGEMALLVQLLSALTHLHAHALSRNGGTSAALLSTH